MLEFMAPLRNGLKSVSVLDLHVAEAKPPTGTGSQR